MLDPDQRIWGFETNFGGMAEIALVRGNQLMPKPAHLSWEEAASMPLVNSTAYRMLVSHNGSQIKQGDIVLIWGAVGGLGGFALQYVLNAGAFPICVVSSADKGKLCETIGARWVIDRSAEKYRFWNADGSQDIREMRRFGKKIRDLTGGEGAPAAEEEEAGDGVLADVDEVATKLDLARAYIDMGDPDGARSILDEVMEEGNDSQKGEAQELFAQL